MSTKTNNQGKEVKMFTKTDLFKIGLEFIDDSFTPRTDLGDLEALATSIAEMGQQTPCIVVKMKGENKYKLVKGKRRFNAIKLAVANGANIEGLLCRSLSKDDESTNLIISLLEEGDCKKRLTAGELLSVMTRLTEDLGMSVEEVAKKTGVSVPQAYRILAVTNTTEAVQEMVKNGEASVSFVAEVQRQEKDTAKQEEIVSVATERAKKAGKKNATMKDAEDMLKMPNGVKVVETKVYTQEASLSEIQMLELAIEDEDSEFATRLRTMIQAIKTGATVEELKIFSQTKLA